MRRKDKKEAPGLDPNFWMVTFSDLLNLLLTFFVLLFAMKAMDKGKLQEALGYFRGGGIGILELGEKMPILRPDLIKRLPQKDRIFSASELKKLLEIKGLKAKVHVSSDKRGIILTLSDAILFDLGSAELKPDSEGILDDLKEVIKETDYLIRVEGHTDNIPISSPNYPTNWELSTARAAHVVRYLLKTDGLRRERFSLVGYADTKPISSNEAPEGRAKNRRVELILIQTH